MSQIMQPPPPDTVAVGDEDSRRRMQFRLWQVLMFTLTVLVATWFSTFGIVSAVLAWVVAKHILVAILLMGLDFYPRYKDELGTQRPG